MQYTCIMNIYNSIVCNSVMTNNVDAVTKLHLLSLFMPVTLTCFSSSHQQINVAAILFPSKTYKNLLPCLFPHKI